MKLRRYSFLMKLVSCAITFSLTVLTVPAGAFTFDLKSLEPTKGKNMPKSRELTSKELSNISGKTTMGENPYLAGMNKWDVMFHGINLFTGNYSTSATDLTFEGGYGIPVNVTRTYCSNNPDEGPFGKGWSLSADIRSTAGGLLKSSSAPVRSVPVSFKERPPTQDDPRMSGDIGTSGALDPVEGVIATDSSGLEETVQRDVDGILSTPVWDKNLIDTTYEHVVVSGNLYFLMLTNTVHTPEGTTYVYEKKGEYIDGGAYGYRDPTGTKVPSNVLKITSATDRHGNATTYTYSNDTVEFAKYNGTTEENKLTGVSMPNGHSLTFTWTSNRITSVSDGTRTVTYDYFPSGLKAGLLETVTSAAGYETNYDYGGAAVPSDWSEEHDTGSGSLLTSITDCRGLTTTISYVMGEVTMLPWGFDMDAPIAYKVIDPNGVKHYAVKGDLHVEGDDDISIDHPGLPFDAVYESNSGDYLTTAGRIVRDGVSTIVIGSTFEFEGTASDADTGTDGYAKKFDIFSQDLIGENTFITSASDVMPSVPQREVEDNPTFTRQRVNTVTAYNFLGNPLSKVVTEYTTPVGGSESTVRTSYIDYAYWGKDKYFQQKAIRTLNSSNAWRYSFTDYFDNTATTGKKGQVYKVYNDKFSSFDNTGGSDWRDDIVPHDTDTYAATFDYDSKGRPIDVWKLQKTTTTPWTYVQTHTAYGADSTPWWGEPTSVIEDYGTGKINRETQTLTYDSIGRATEVQDASGQVFETVYDLDGRIQSITRTDTTPDVPIVTYVYGASGVENGAVTSVTDELENAETTVTYSSTAGGSYGQVTNVHEDSENSRVYDVSYTYTAEGDRSTATYDTPNGTVQWRYSDYGSYGPDGARAGRAFQTLTKMDYVSSTWVPSSEEFHYQYDGAGRLMYAAFAQTPKSGFTPGTGDPWYDGGHPADHRAVAQYLYEPGGRITSLEYWWQDWVPFTGYTDTRILGNDCSYNAYTALKTESLFKVKDVSTNTWVTERTETYGYDADLDYLTSADYDDGLAAETPTWTYDAAGNRLTVSGSGSPVYDNLNRMTTDTSGNTYTNDILGNRTFRNYGAGQSAARSYDFDEINRMVASRGLTTGAKYKYRADGMRTHKMEGFTLSENWVHVENQKAPVFSGYYDNDPEDAPTTRYYYDGQMPMEEDYTDGGTNDYVMRNGLGARGIDYVAKTQSSTTTVGFPIYDAHGNNVAMLSRNGSGGFNVNDRRAYDAWGVIRQGNTTGDPKGRYCANLGHVQDDESGLVYMRARYYEPTNGRFINQDTAFHGWNWFVYANNMPTAYIDINGQDATATGLMWVTGLMFWLPALILTIMFEPTPVADGLAHMAMVCFAAALAGCEDLYGSTYGAMLMGVCAEASYYLITHVILKGIKKGTEAGGLAFIATLSVGFYSLVILAALAANATDEEERNGGN